VGSARARKRGLGLVDLTTQKITIWLWVCQDWAVIRRVWRRLCLVKEAQSEEGDGDEVGRKDGEVKRPKVCAPYGQSLTVGMVGM
jgi:hypothetical protein